MINSGQNQPSAIMVPQVDYYWKFTTSSAGTGTAGSWKLFYEGAPARKKGEIDTVTASVSYSHTFTGSIATEIKKKVQVQLGYSFGVSKSLSASRATKALQKGQYVKAYYIKNYKLTNIKQKQYKHTYGWKCSPGGSYNYINETTTTGKTKKAVAKEAILPKIKFKYFTKSKSKSKSKATQNNRNALEKDTLLFTEYYEYVDNHYVLNKVEWGE